MTRRAQLEQLLAAEPHDPFLRYGLAMTCVSDGDFAAARAHFEQLLEENANYVAGYFQLAQLLARQGDFEEAKPLLQTGIAAALKAGDDHAAAEMTAFLDSL
jgi:tetratricopeptide (TPR) repeat protein